MNCRIARAYGVTPDVPWHWPFTFWVKVRDELVDSLKPPKKKGEDDEWLTLQEAREKFGSG